METTRKESNSQIFKWDGSSSRLSLFSLATDGSPTSVAPDRCDAFHYGMIQQCYACVLRSYDEIKDPLPPPARAVREWCEPTSTSTSKDVVFFLFGEKKGKEFHIFKSNQKINPYFWVTTSPVALFI